MLKKIKIWWKQLKCEHDWILFAQGENVNRHIRYGIYECSKCGKNTHPTDPETIYRKTHNIKNY